MLIRLSNGKQMLTFSNNRWAGVNDLISWFRDEDKENIYITPISFFKAIKFILSRGNI